MYFMETMHALKKLAQRTNTIGFIIHQADAKQLKYKTDPRPKFEDIEWSQDVFRLSAYIYMCYYPSKYFSEQMFREDCALIFVLAFLLFF